MHDVWSWLLLAESRARDTTAHSARSTAPFQDKEASRSQPSVLDETRLIVSGKLRHFRAAQGIARHPLADVGVTAPPDLRAAADCISSKQRALAPWRARQVGRLQSLAESPALLQMSEQILALAPPHLRWAVGPHAHPALMMVFVDALDWPDKHFAYRQYIGGWPVIGWPAGTGLHVQASFCQGYGEGCQGLCAPRSSQPDEC